MLSHLQLVAQQVAILFILMSVGFACHRLHFISRITIRGIVKLLIYIVTPTLIIHAFQRPFDPALAASLGWGLAAAFFAHVTGGILAFLFLHRAAPARLGVYRFAVIFSNAGFMGIPLEYAILGPRGVFYGAAYIVMFNLLCWTVGLLVMRGGFREIAYRAILINPGTIGVLLGLPFFLFSWHLPAVLATPIQYISDINTPLAMIMAGWYLAEAPVRPILTDWRAYLVAILKLFAMPLVVFAALWALVPVLAFDSCMCIAIVIAAAAPTGALTTAIAACYDRDVSLATSLVAGTTLLSILTLPPVIALALHAFKA